MVSSLSIAFMVVSLLIAVLMPIALVVYFYKKQRISLKVVFIGAGVFVVSQLLTRIPLLAYINTQEWYKSMASNVVILAIFLGITAGLFEEVGRYLAMKLFMKNKLEWKDGLAFGIGHGGIEAIVLVGMGLINTIIMSFMINAGVFNSLVGASLKPEVIGQIKSALVDPSSITFLAGGYERIMTMIIQIALSMVVLYAVKAKKPIFLLYAILLHGVVDSPVVIFSGMKINIWVIELYVTVCAAAGLALILKLGGVFSKLGQKVEIGA